METDAKKRKALPLCTGVFDYFPDALLAVAELSRVGNDQHNPGKPLHWDRAKSGDESDALSRHLFERGTLDTDGVRHSTKLAWRALALLQKELEEQTGVPVSRGSIAAPRLETKKVIPAPVSAGDCDIPTGWVHLKEGSVIRKGDYYWSPSFNEWLPASWIGEFVGDGNMTDFTYIRHI